MEYLALSIFVSTVLFLVDRNRAWPQFWKVSRWLGIVAILIAIGSGAYYEYQQHHQKQPDWFEANAPH
jgi:hypothetical protein